MIDWIKKLWSEIKQNYSNQTKTEHLYWIIICLSIIMFGLYLKMFWFSLFLSIVVVFLGTLALEINKPVVLMVATLFFTIVIFFEQNKNLKAQLNTQIESLNRQIQSLESSRKEIKLQYTPDIRSWITYSDIRPGTYDPSKPGRIDDFIVIPITICNRTYGYAKDIVLTMCYDFGNGNRILDLSIPLMKGGDVYPYAGFNPSVAKGFQELILNKKRNFKMKIIIDWEDASGKEYKSVEKFILRTEKQGTDVPLMFLFKSEGFYSSIDSDLEVVNNHSNLKIDF